MAPEYEAIISLPCCQIWSQSSLSRDFLMLSGSSQSLGSKDNSFYARMRCFSEDSINNINTPIHNKTLKSKWKLFLKYLSEKRAHCKSHRKRGIPSFNRIASLNGSTEHSLLDFFFKNF